MQYYSDKVRTRKQGSELYVEILKDQDWMQYWSTDEQSNDYAYTETRRIAASVAERIKLNGDI